MTEERNNDSSDPVVSDLYRESASERAPASLNEAVLRNAAAHANKGYAHSMLWMRPLAYAATVVLSLAIVVQIVLPPSTHDAVPAASLSPAAEAEQLDLYADLVDAPAGEATDDDDPLKRLRDQEVREETKIEEFDVPAVVAETVPEVSADMLPQDEPEALPQVTAQLGRVDANSAAALEEIAVQGQTPPETADLESAALSSAMVMEEAGDMAALRSMQPGNYAYSVSQAAPIEESVCEPDDVESPNTWAECIERLEEAGRSEEAIAERVMLITAFPDFEWPAE